MHTTARHTFHHQTMPVYCTLITCILYINYPFSQVLVLKISQAAFAVACFWGLSDLHECSGVLQMAPSPLDKQTADCDSPHNWLMSVAMDLAVLCDTVYKFNLKWYIPMDVIWLFSVWIQPLPTASWFSSTPHPPVKNYLKWWAIQLAIHSTVSE